MLRAFIAGAPVVVIAGLATSMCKPHVNSRSATNPAMLGVVVSWPLLAVVPVHVCGARAAHALAWRVLGRSNFAMTAHRERVALFSIRHKFGVTINAVLPEVLIARLTFPIAACPPFTFPPADFAVAVTQFQISWPLDAVLFFVPDAL